MGIEKFKKLDNLWKKLKANAVVKVYGEIPVPVLLN